MNNLQRCTVCYLPVFLCLHYNSPLYCNPFGRVHDACLTLSMILFLRSQTTSWPSLWNSTSICTVLKHSNSLLLEYCHHHSPENNSTSAYPTWTSLYRDVIWPRLWYKHTGIIGTLLLGQSWSLFYLFLLIPGFVTLDLLSLFPEQMLKYQQTIWPTQWGLRYKLEL